MKLLVDMNLPPEWVEEFTHHGFEAAHWSTVGDPRASDRVIMDWARSNHFVVFTHDLDFGTILAVTSAAGPSVIQVRARDLMPSHIGGVVVAAIKQYEDLLDAGALITVDEASSRARVFPLGR